MDDFLLAPPPAAAFDGEAGLKPALACLEEQEAASLLVPVVGPEQLELRPDGRTKAGYRMGRMCFRQVCQALSAGLYHLVCELAGERGRDPELPNHCYDAAEAVSLYNVVVRRRWAARLADKQLLRDGSLGTLDALVGQNYRRASNASILRHVLETLEASDPGARPERIEVVGRRLSLTFCRPEPVHKTPGDRWLAGYYFANSEAGDAALRAAPCLHLVGAVPAVGLTSRSGGRLRHAGAFEQRLRRVLARAAQVTPAPDKFAAWVASLEAEPLGMTGQLEDDDRRLTQLRMVFDRLRMHGRDGRAVLRRALCGTEPPARPNLARPDRSGWTERTAYDLLAALLRQARGWPPVRRDAGQRAAWGILTGAVRLPEPVVLSQRR